MKRFFSIASVIAILFSALPCNGNNVVQETSLSGNLVKNTKPVVRKYSYNAISTAGYMTQAMSDAEPVRIYSDIKTSVDTDGLKKDTSSEKKIPVYTVVEQMPSFPGGEEALMKYISSHIKYPPIAHKKGVQGTVMLRFVVLPSGEVGDVQVLKGLDPYCDREAKRVVKSLPKFIPGKQQGRAVAVWFTSPVRFQIDDNALSTGYGTQAMSDTDSVRSFSEEITSVDTDSLEKDTSSEKKIPVYTVVEQMPSFPGGEEALMRYISSHIKYPPEASKEGVQGTVMLRFVVLPSGEVGDVQVLKSLDPYCDREAKRVVKSLPKFIPGKQQGRAVAVWFTSPVRFQID